MVISVVQKDGKCDGFVKNSSTASLHIKDIRSQCLLLWGAADFDKKGNQAIYGLVPFSDYVQTLM
jgi:hypothetical protein